MTNHRVIIFYILTFLTLSLHLIAEESKPLIEWAFEYKNTDDSIIKVINPYHKKTALLSGNGIKIYIKPIALVYVYIFLYDSQYNLIKLFPESLKNSLPLQTEIVIPEKEDRWLILDENEGVENFYLLVSKKPLLKLEELIKKKDEVCNRDNKNISCRDATRLLLEEIRNILIENVIAENSKEVLKPIPMSGSIKGPEYIILVEGKNFYGKRIIIEHKK